MIPIDIQVSRSKVKSILVCLGRGAYRITGIFCGCLIFAEFCGSIEIAEIENRKIFQSRYNDEIVSEVELIILMNF